jgi:hypothetical protein
MVVQVNSVSLNKHHPFLTASFDFASRSIFDNANECIDKMEIQCHVISAISHFVSLTQQHKRCTLLCIYGH